MVIRGLLVGEPETNSAELLMGLHPRCGRAGTTAAYCGRCGSRVLTVGTLPDGLRPAGRSLVRGRYSLLLCARCGGRQPEGRAGIGSDSAEADEIIDPRD